MKIGDLVTDPQGFEIGIILGQIGCVDRWWVYWLNRGYKSGYNGSSLELL